MNYSNLLITSSLFVIVGCTTTQNLINQNQTSHSVSKTGTTIRVIKTQGSPTTTKEAKAIYTSNNSCGNIDYNLLLVNQSVKDIEKSTEKCLQNSNSRYEFAKALFQKGFVEESLNQLQLIPKSKTKNSNLALLETSDLVKRMDSPFVYAAEAANRKLERWLTRASEVPSFDLKPPVRKDSPTPPVIVRSEFETTSAYNVRKKTIEKKYLEQVNRLELEYQQALTDYNNNVVKYNAALQWEIKSRKERANLMRNDFLISEINSALGKLLIDNLNYNADQQIYYADLVSTESNYTTRIAIEVPLQDAREFKKGYKGIFPQLTFQVVKGAIKINSISIPYNGSIYRASLTDHNYDFSPAREVVSLKTMKDLKVKTSVPDQKLLRSQININQVVDDNRKFFQNVIN